MADHCNICDTRRPEGGTKILIVNSGDWLEFCPRCEDHEMENVETGERATLLEIWASAQERTLN